MNHFCTISIIFTLFFVAVSSFGMDIKPRKSGARPKSDVRPLKALRKAHKSVLPDGKLSFILNDLLITEKLYKKWSKLGAFTANDLISHENMCGKFKAMETCINITRQLYAQELVFAELTNERVREIKYAIASQKMLIQFYLIKLTHALSSKHQSDFYCKTYKELFEKVMSAEYNQKKLVAKTMPVEHQHEKIGDLLNVVRFSFCEDGGSKGFFVFLINSDPFKKVVSSSSGLHYECGYFTGHKSFYYLYETWLRHSVQKDDEKTFTYLLKEDPFDCNNKVVCRDQGPILSSIFYTGEKAEKYMKICKEHGCKTREEVQQILRAREEMQKISPTRIR